MFATLKFPFNETSDATYKVFLKMVKPLTSKAYADEMSLLIATDLLPDPSFTFPFIDTSAVNTARFTTYKLPFKDKSLPTDRFPLKEESPETNIFVPKETSDKTKRLLRNIVVPLTSNANAEEMSLLIETELEPEPMSTFWFIDTSKVKTLRFATYKLPFNDKSPPTDKAEPTDKLPLNDESPITKNRLLKETSPSTSRP